MINKINTGLVKMIILENLNESLLNEKSLNILKETVSKFCNVVNDSPLLQLEYRLFENLENVKNIDNDIIATRYIDNNIKLFEKYSIDEINNEHKKLLEFIDVNNTYNIDVNKIKINESIYNLIIESNKLNVTPNIDLLHESFITVLNYLKDNKNNIIINENNDDTSLNNSIVEIAISKFNDKFNKLDENDKDLFKILTKSSKEEKKSIFEKYKSDIKITLENINNDEIKDRINESINKIDKMEYNNKTINDDIITLFELNNALKPE